ncbi:MAG TPA: SDR family oxidoreductase [Solirubrobacteraceae bacterium]|nr:SDR family oxidoreductase [Solirubrobacteraceae bacterium]
MDGLIAVTGATGAMGGRVAARLAAAGAAQRLLVRDPSRAPALERAEAVAIGGGYDDGPSLETALTGVTTLFLVPAHEDRDRVALHRTVVESAVAAGVRRIVYLSFLGTGPECTFTFGRDHFHTEQLIRGGGLAWTFLRMSLYLDFLPGFAGEDGVIRGPAGDGRVGAVLRDDLADVAAAVLLAGDPAVHDGQTYDVTGAEALTLAEVADTVSRATGRTVTYHAETLDEAYASRAAYGAPDWEVEGWVTSYTAIAKGELDVATDTVERLAGHPPITLAEFLARGAEPA